MVGKAPAHRAARPYDEDAVAQTYESPPQRNMPTHDFTLQAVMEMQKSIGGLETSVKSLNESLTKISGKIDSLETKVSGISHKVYAAGVVLAILIAIGGTVGGFIVNKAWDIAFSQVMHSANTVQPAKNNKP